MKIKITINVKSEKLAEAIAIGQNERNERFDETMTAADIKTFDDKEDALSAIQYLDWNNIDVEKISPA